MSTEQRETVSPAAGPDQQASTRWEGYSDYRYISGKIAQSVFEALSAYAEVDARHTEGARVSPELASEARQRIHTAILNVRYEMESDRDAVEDFDEILGRWEGDEGFVAQFHSCSLRAGMPGFLGQLVQDIRAAAFELGYLQAGRTGRAEVEDEVERETDAMVVVS